MEKKINLSDGEWKLMNCLWEQSPRTITALVAALKDDTGWTKHTIISMLSRMEAKGVIKYIRGERAKQYYPVIQHKNAAIAETHSFLSKVYGGKIGLMLNAMVDQEALTMDELDELYAILGKAERFEERNGHNHE